VAELYRKSYWSYAANRPSSVRSALANSSDYLAEHMHEVPVLVLFCYEGRPEQPTAAAQAGFYGSILPAAWSFMLALRARGVGSAWTTLHLRYEQETAELLGLPPNLTQAVLMPIAYYTGDDFKPAPREPVIERTHWNGWGRRRESM
jgi:nitroreductase